MEQNLRQFTLVGGESAYFDLRSVAMLEPRGENCFITLVSGAEFTILGDMNSVEAVLGELRMHGVGQRRINPDHVLAITSLGENGCRICLPSGKSITCPDIAVAEILHVIRQHQKYPWDTITLKGPK